MAADNSDNLKPRPATSHINMDYYSSDSNNSEAAKNDLVDGESDSDEHIRDLSVGSHSPESWMAYNDESRKLKTELSMHLKNKDRKEVARVQQEINDHFRRGEVDISQLDPDTIARLEAIDGPEPQSAPRSAVRLPTQPSASLLHAGSSQALVVTPHSLPLYLNLNRMSAPHIADNGILEAGSTRALNGLNRALYCKASPVNLDYKTLLNFEMTLLEMTTYIPLAFLWLGGFLSRVESAGRGCTIVAQMMLWVRGLDNGTDLKNKLGNLRSTMQHKLKNYGTSDSTNKTASSWVPTNIMTTRAKPNLTADISLLRLRHGVTRPPQGQHRGRLTIAIEHAYICGHWGVMLSEVERYMEHFKLEVPKKLTEDADKLAIKDFESIYEATSH
ncbi:hypothetical protein GT037_002778 [Alternaria burnsii]|uniref:Uncharacterized protein n=1 Tax=Alternaria burnsii TaxID=1187904 RepID=A0A8H7EHM3_9PLEO|nr:uncharacterized protein GT037_002778 [Alternaria burnsii]KAF7679030.1 hypothetical protein GT037_002778 [Alternaria burnsii]CAI9631953.1 unnamed protein product [Alternaria burnsii]